MSSKQNTVVWSRIHVFFTKAVTRALKLYPDVNSMMDGDYKIAYDFCDITQYQDQRVNGSCCS
jgi:pyruvate/2-oxoglutarate dehydrogenase complex dihydrolipoamide acyltransferase (E2) component